MKRRNPRLIVVACAIVASLAVPSLVVASTGPGLGFAVHQESGGWSLTAWFSKLGSSVWTVLTYDASQQDTEIDKLGVEPDPNGNRRFQRAGTAPETHPGSGQGVGTDGG
jgi:hypothetical protein